MCFSPEASFAVGGALIPVGGYCLWSALHKKPKSWGLALVPIGFGMQQISEGFVWLGIRAEDDALKHSAALVYLFFALAFWPFWFPFMATLWEDNRKRKWMLAGVTLISTAWFWVLYFPFLVENGVDFTINTEHHHSIRYDILSLPIYRISSYASPVLKLFYVLSLASPFIFSSDRGGWVPGLLIGSSVAVAELAYHHAFVSVWCFFAAVMTSYIGWVYYRMPATPVASGER